MNVLRAYPDWSRPSFLRNAALMRSTVATLALLMFSFQLHAATDDDLDAYKWRIDGLWWFSQPTGSFQGANDSGSFDLSKDFGFSSYSTFSAKVDWRFKRKHHLLLGISPVFSSRTTTLSRTIEFQGVTYDLGAQVSADIRSLSFAPGYQYDIIRRKRGYLAIATQVFLLNTKATLSGTAFLNGVSATRKASGSIFAPLPVFGPQTRWYLSHSGRFALDGSVQGMYFFGYGNFVTAKADAVFSITRHLNLLAGYEMGTRLSIHGSSDQIGVRLTQKGPTAGIELQW